MAGTRAATPAPAPALCSNGGNSSCGRAGTGASLWADGRVASCGRQHRALPASEAVPATSSILSLSTLWCLLIMTLCILLISLQTSHSFCEPQWLYTSRQNWRENISLELKTHHLSLLLNSPVGQTLPNATHIHRSGAILMTSDRLHLPCCGCPPMPLQCGLTFPYTNCQQDRCGFP